MPVECLESRQTTCVKRIRDGVNLYIKYAFNFKLIIINATAKPRVNLDKFHIFVRVYVCVCMYLLTKSTTTNVSIADYV